MYMQLTIQTMRKDGNEGMSGNSDFCFNYTNLGLLFSWDWQIFSPYKWDQRTALNHWLLFRLDKPSVNEQNM